MYCMYVYIYIYIICICVCIYIYIYIYIYRRTALAERARELLAADGCFAMKRTPANSPQ